MRRGSQIGIRFFSESSPPCLGGVDAASADGVVILKNLILLWRTGYSNRNQILQNYHPASAKPPAPLLNKEGSSEKIIPTHDSPLTIPPLTISCLPLSSRVRVPILVRGVDRRPK